MAVSMPVSTQTARPVGFAIPGPLDRLSGGTLYDLAVIEGAARGPWPLTPIELPSRFPWPSPADLAATAERLAAWRGPLLIDGLAYGAFPAALAERVGPRTVALVHHPLAHETGLAPERAAALERSERTALGLARAVVCTSPATARALERGYGVPAAKLVVARPGVTRPPSPAPRLGRPPVILALGATIVRKNFDGLVRALAHLGDLAWTARIVGPVGVDPAADAALEAAIAASGLGARIRRVGPVADPRAELLAADLFVSASLYEGYGMALAEAVVCGLPVVAVAGGATAETAPSAISAAAPPPDAPLDALDRSLAAAIRPLLEDEARREQAAQASLAAALTAPTWADTVANVSAALARAFSAEPPYGST